MTYNFDPDQWYDTEIEFLRKQYHGGKISKQAFARIMDTLERRYDDMLKQLNGICQIPKS